MLDSKHTMVIADLLANDKRNNLIICLTIYISQGIFVSTAHEMDFCRSNFFTT
jgi:hypothetical protein